MKRHHPASAPIPLFLLEVGSMDARLIGLSVERHMKHTLRLTEDMASARAVLIDCDRHGADESMRQARQQQGLGIVGYAFNPADRKLRFPGIVILGKPLSLNYLPNVLQEAIAAAARAPAAPTLVPDPPKPPEAPSSLGHGVQAEDEMDLCGALDDIPPARSGPLPDKIFFEPDDYLIGQMARAVKQSITTGRPQAVAGLPRLIRVELKPTLVCLTAFRDNQLRPFSMTQLPHATARIVPAPSFHEAAGTEVASAAEDFLWNVAAWAARGRLPAGTNPYRAVRLTAWPNFTRAFLSPHALRIAALWVRGFASPVDIALRLAIPQRYVFSFFTAAHFAGLLDTRTPASVKAPPPASKEPPAQKPSILSRILRKLLHAA